MARRSHTLGKDTVVVVEYSDDVEVWSLELHDGVVGSIHNNIAVSFPEYKANITIIWPSGEKSRIERVWSAEFAEGTRISGGRVQHHARYKR